MAKWLDWIRNWFGRTTAPHEDYVDVSASEQPPTPDSRMPEKRSWLTRWTPGAQRERQIAWLQAGYSEMLNLMRGIHTHLERQEDVQHKLVAALEQLPASLDNLKNLGKAAEQQVEALALLRDQLARSVQHDQQLAESMNRFNQTLGLLDETARASGRTVEELVQQAREEDRLLHELVRRSERRFIFVTSLFVLVLVAMVGAVAFTVRPWRDGKASLEPHRAVVSPVLEPSASRLEQMPIASNAAPALVEPATDHDAVASQDLRSEISSAISDASAVSVGAVTNAVTEPAETPPAKPRKAKRSLFRRRAKLPAQDVPAEVPAATSEVAP